VVLGLQTRGPWFQRTKKWKKWSTAQGDRVKRRWTCKVEGTSVRGDYERKHQSVNKMKTGKKRALKEILEPVFTRHKEANSRWEKKGNGWG